MSYPHQSTDDPPRVRELEVAEVGQLTSDTQIFGTSIRLDVLNEGIHVAVHGATVLDRLMATTVLRRLFCFRVLCSPHSVLPHGCPCVHQSPTLPRLRLARRGEATVTVQRGGEEGRSNGEMQRFRSSERERRRFEAELHPSVA